MKCLVLFVLCTLPSGALAFAVPRLSQRSASALAAAANGSSETTKKKVLVLGGDGFCGWPTSLYLSDQGHTVVCVDNLSRRNIDIELGCDSLTPIQSPEVRVCVCVSHRGGGLSSELPSYLPIPISHIR
jgi:hypothetical protein